MSSAGHLIAAIGHIACVGCLHKAEMV